MSAQYVVPDEWVRAAMDAWWRAEGGASSAMRAALAAVLPLAVAQERERIAAELEALAKTLQTLVTLKEYSREQRRAYANQADTFRMKAAAIRQEPGHE